jgi:hypothetical protein
MNIGPNLYPTKKNIYVPTYSLDGKTWTILNPSFDPDKAKSQLRSALPDGDRMEQMPASLIHCGMYIIPIQSVEEYSFYEEYSPEDFTVGSC